MSNPKVLSKFIKHHLGSLVINESLLDIYNGNLSHHVDLALRDQLSEKSYHVARKRLAPVNFLKQYVDKTAKIFNESPERTSPDDQEFVDYYTQQYELDHNGRLAACYYQTCRSFLYAPYYDVEVGEPALRVIKPSHFLVFSDSMIDSTRPTHFLILNRTERRESGMVTHVFYVYGVDGSFWIQDQEGKIMMEEMRALNLEDGFIGYNAAPFIYCKNRPDTLMPKPDQDTYNMSVLLPVLLTDLNLISMFSGFPIMYGINVSGDKLKRSPNVFWDLKADTALSPDAKPEIGVITPNADINKFLDSFKEQLTAWMSTRGVKADLGDSSISVSGISKMMDHLDISEVRTEMTGVFTKAETDLMDLTAEHLNPFWRSEGFDVGPEVSQNFSYSVRFQEQKPMTTLSGRIADAKALEDAGYINKERAIRMVFPHATEEEITQLLEEANEGETSRGDSGGPIGRADSPDVSEPDPVEEPDEI